MGDHGALRREEVRPAAPPLQASGALIDLHALPIDCIV